jgi:hypothetical protein
VRSDAVYIALWAVVLINSLVLFRLVRRLRPVFEPKRKIPEVPSLPEGTEAPHFHAETIDGEIISLADFAGGGFSLVVVGFTDTASRQEIHDTLRVRHGFPGPIVVVTRNHVLRRLYNPKGAT